MDWVAYVAISTWVFAILELTARSHALGWDPVMWSSKISRKMRTWCSFRKLSIIGGESSLPVCPTPNVRCEISLLGLFPNIQLKDGLERHGEIWGCECEDWGPGLTHLMSCSAYQTQVRVNDGGMELLTTLSSLLAWQDRQTLVCGELDMGQGHTSGFPVLPAAMGIAPVLPPPACWHFAVSCFQQCFTRCPVIPGFLKRIWDFIRGFRAILTNYISWFFPLSIVLLISSEISQSSHARFGFQKPSVCSFSI